MLQKLSIPAICSFLFLCVTGYGQGSFRLPEGKKHLKIPVEISNNLMIVPVSVNGTPLSFLLDTGVKSNVIFNVGDFQNLKLHSQQTITLSGAGTGESAEAIISRNNVISIGSSTAISQTIYFIHDERYNFSPRLGKEVHGIIGYELFKDFVVELNYDRSYVKLYDREWYNKKPCRSCLVKDIRLVAGKPYTDVAVTTTQGEIEGLNMLLDSGSGDAVWLFEDSHKRLKIEVPNFDDFLGLGLNGEVHGKRAKLDNVDLGGIALNDVTVAYPDSLSTKDMRLKRNGRNGSVGAEILRRFTVVLDYESGTAIFRKNRDFDNPFRYNRSGLIVSHSGYDLVKEIADNIVEDLPDDSALFEDDTPVFAAVKTIQFTLRRNYEIAEIREDSPAAKAGLQVGDMILKINGKNTANLELADITKHFFKDEGYRLRLKVARDGVVLNYKLKLKRLL
ncbi:MAG: aspartyl protease family protein [Leeuwenhoekiella sp.]